jgi:branched-chain amino acid transport system ATP-binding protein
MKLLELISLRKQFGELVAINNVDLVISEGEIHGLIGPNGSGKTTLFNLITGFLKPTKGKIIWQGKDITGLSPYSVAKRGIARSFQANVLLSSHTVLQNISMACHLHTGMGLFEQFLRTAGVLKKEKAVEKKSKELLGLMGLAGMENEIAGKLPQGYQRSLGIAIALATEPKLLLLDEPVAGLNSTEKNVMMKTIRMIRSRNVTIVLVEHDMKAVMSACEKVTVLNFGQKIAEGIPEEIFTNKDVIEAYLGGG